MVSFSTVSVRETRDRRGTGRVALSPPHPHTPTPHTTTYSHEYVGHKYLLVAFGFSGGLANRSLRCTRRMDTWIKLSNLVYVIGGPEWGRQAGRQESKIQLTEGLVNLLDKVRCLHPQNPRPGPPSASSPPPCHQREKKKMKPSPPPPRVKSHRKDSLRDLLKPLSDDPLPPICILPPHLASTSLRMGHALGMLLICRCAPKPLALGNSSGKS